MKFFIRKFLTVLCFGMVLQTTPVICMEQQPQRPSTAALLRALGVGVAQSVVTMCFATQVMSYFESAGQTFDNALFDGARHIVPVAAALVCYGAQKIAEKKDRLACISTGTHSRLWLGAETVCSSVKSLIVQGSIFGAFSSPLSHLYYGVGSATATTCSALAGVSGAVCSYVADKTAKVALSAVSLAAVTSTMALFSRDTSQLRTKKTARMATPCAEGTSADEQSAAGVLPATSLPKKVSSLGVIELKGPQIYYFLASQGCDIEPLWWRFISQTKQVKASKNGTWRQSCARKLDHLKKSITASFKAAQKKLPESVRSTVAELINTVMPFGQYPQPQFLLDKSYLEKQPALHTYSIVVDKESCAIFEGIKTAVLSYFDPACIQARNQQGDEAIFNPPLTPVFITPDGESVTITAYPQSRQDCMYPHQWQTEVKYPRWFRYARAALPFVIGEAIKAFFSTSGTYFLPDGTRCFVRDGQAFCDGDQAVALTSCSSYSACMEEFISKRPSVSSALGILELDPHGSYTERDLKKQFRSLAFVHHPDKNPDDPSAHERFIQINEAYKYLCQHMTNK